MPINFTSLYLLSVETTLLYYATIINAYVKKRWRMGKQLTIADRDFIKTCSATDHIEAWVASQQNLYLKSKIF